MTYAMKAPPVALASVICAILMGQMPCAGQNAEKVSLRFLSFPKAMEPVKVRLRVSETEAVDIEAPSHWFSPALQVSNPGVWSVGESIEGPDGKQVYKEYGRTKSLGSPQQMLLLVRKGENNADGFDLIALDGRMDGFGGGKFLFMNTAKVDIAGVVGEEKFVVKPGQHIIIKPKAENGKRTFHTQLFFRKGDEPQSFFSSKWPIKEDTRRLIFFYHDPRTMHIRFHSIRDFL